MEREAVKAALSDDFLKNESWITDEQGRIKTVKGRTIFPAGFATALRKMLDHF
jgi:hypothetical protein